MSTCATCGETFATGEPVPGRLSQPRSLVNIDMCVGCSAVAGPLPGPTFADLLAEAFGRRAQ